MVGEKFFYAEVFEIVVVSIISYLLAVSPVIAGGRVDKSGVRPQVLNLPSGPGSIEGLGESFEPQLNSGTATYRVPIALSPGRAGFAPALTIVYNGGKGNSQLGIGWRLSSSSVQRQTEKGLPVYDDAKDTFINDQGEELVPLADGKYRCENETAFDLFERVGDSWKSSHRDGSKTYFGLNRSERIQDGKNIFKWCISRQEDTNGNKILYKYNEEKAFPDGIVPTDGQVYLTSIVYNQGAGDSQVMRVVLKYETRPFNDRLFDYRSRFPVQTSQRCKEILMTEGGQRVRSYKLIYDSQAIHSRLHKVEMYGRDAGQGPLESILTFEYTIFNLNSNLTPMDTGINPGVGLDLPDVDLVDMNGDAFPDLIYTGDVHEVFINVDGRKWESSYDVAGGFTEVKLKDPNTMLMDMSGDGYSDLFRQDTSIDGYSYFTGGQSGDGWNLTPREMENSPGFTFGDNTKPVDLDNDGRTDVLWKSGFADEIACVFNLNGLAMSGVFTIDSPSMRGEFNFGPEASSGLRLADMNGDGLQDFVILNGEDQIWYYPGHGVTIDPTTPWIYQGWDNTPRGAWEQVNSSTEGFRMANAPDGIDEPDFSEVANFRKLRLVDVNGDGLTDLVYIANNRLAVWLNMGGSAFSPNPYVVTPASGKIPALTAQTYIRTVDMNANGTVDVVWNRQTGFAEVGQTEATWVYLDITNSVRPNLLRQIDNGIGQVTTIKYKSSTEYLVADRANGVEWAHKLPIPVNVVSSIKIFDGQNSTYVREMTYHDGYYDGKEKEFRGFERAEQREVGDKNTNIPDLIMSYTFDTGAEEESLKGKPKVLEARTTDGKVFYREEYTWDTISLLDGIKGDERKVTFPFQKEKRRDIREKGSGTPVKLKWEYEYDDYGNVTKQIDHGRLDAGWDDERITESTYSANYASGKAKWILDKVVTTTTKDEKGNKAAEKRNYYDGNLALGEVTRANLTKVEYWVRGSKYVTSVRNDYDQYGNIVALYDPLYGIEPGHFRQLVYDQTYHTFPIEEKIYTGSLTLTMSATYDPGWGVMRSSTDYNGFTTTYGYDTFGRLTSITKPPDADHTVEYDYKLAQKLKDNKVINWVETRQRDGSEGDGFLKSRSFYDGLGRKVMTRSEGEYPGQIVVTDTVKFNARKVPWKKYLPYFETGTLDFREPTFNTGFTEHIYDALGREIHMNQPVVTDGILCSTTTYKPLEKIVKDEEQTRKGSIHSGNGMRYVTDGLLDKDGNGRLREVYEIVKLSDIGEPQNNPSEWKTAYSYDLLDNLTGYVDSQNNRKFMEYDGLSRKTFMNDPDRGHMTYTYDDASNLSQTVDAKGQVINYTYDGVNRLTAEFYGADKSVADVEYHYDEQGNPVGLGDLWQGNQAKVIADVILTGKEHDSGIDLNGDRKLDVADVVTATQMFPQGNTLKTENTKGFLSWVRDQSGEEYNSYDERGRVRWVVKRIKSNNKNGLNNYYTSMEYDSMDRVTTLAYPDGTYVNYKYNSRGLLESVPHVIDSYDYNSAGQNRKLTLACGTVTTYGYDHRLRLSSLKTVRKRDGLSLQDLKYTYDGVSNITNIADGRDNEALDTIGTELGIGSAEARKFNATQSFMYDSLYRLTQAKNNDVYGTIDYRYDRIGNMIKKDAVLSDPDPLMDLGEMKSGGTARTSDRIGRDPGNPPGPHAITSTEKGPNGAMTFTYDDNGNLLADGGMDMSWDFKDRLTGLTNGTKSAQYIYDYTDTRKKKSVNDTGSSSKDEVFYIDKLSEVRNGKLVKYVYAGASRVARLNSASENSTHLESSIKDPVSTFYLHDHLGSSNLSITGSASVAEQMVNYPFGHQRNQKKANPSKNLADYKFTGKETDIESGLQYFEARYLSGYLGRFISVDKGYGFSPHTGIINTKTHNLYSYAFNNPLVLLDPDGNEPKKLAKIPKVLKLYIPDDKKLKKIQDAFKTAGKDLIKTFKSTKMVSFSGKKVRLQGKAADALVKVGARLDKLVSAKKLSKGWLKSIGGFNPRTQEKSSKLSEHSFGNAVDVNNLTNPMKGTRGKLTTDQLRKKGKMDMPDVVIDAFKAEGFKWGGDFKGKGRFDPMHFEFTGKK